MNQTDEFDASRSRPWVRSCADVPVPAGADHVARLVAGYAVVSGCRPDSSGADDAAPDMPATAGPRMAKDAIAPKYRLGSGRSERRATRRVVTVTLKVATRPDQTEDPCPTLTAMLGAASIRAGARQRTGSPQASRLLRTAFHRRRSSGSRRPGARRCARSSGCSGASRAGPGDESEGDPDGCGSPAAEPVGRACRLPRGGLR